MADDRADSDFLWIDQELRPLRLVFLVDPSRPEELFHAIRANTALWGGEANFIVPYTASQYVDIARRPTELKRLLELAEPDFVIDVARHQFDLGRTPDKDDEKPFGIEEVLDESGRVAHGLGLGMQEIYDHLYRSHHQFSVRHPRTFVALAPDERHDPFASAIFGLLPVGRWARLSASYQEYFQPLGATSNPSDIYKASIRDLDYPLALTNTGLDIERPYRPVPLLLVLDPSDTRDIMTYWNLRAMGHDVMPVSFHALDDWIVECRAYVNDRSRYTIHTHFPFARIVPARNELQSFAETLSPRIEVRQGGSIRISRVPGFGESSDIVGDDHRCRRISLSRTFTSTLQSGRALIPAMAPEFDLSRRNMGHYVWANQFWISGNRRNGSSILIPQDIPESECLFSERLKRERNRLVFPCTDIDDNIDVDVPDGRDFLRVMANKAGARVEHSAAGLILRRFLASLGDLSSVSLLAHRPVIRLLDEMAHGAADFDATEARKPRARGRAVSVARWFTLAKEIMGSDFRAREWLRALVEKNVLQIGLLFDCEDCGQQSWHPLGQIADIVQCERCLSPIRFPAEGPPKNWAYRTRGVFAIENYASGGYTAALVLRWLRTVTHYQVAWAEGALLRSPDFGELEMDLMVFVEGHGFRPRQRVVRVACECKSFPNGVEPASARRDIARLQSVRKAMPGTHMLFACMSEEPPAEYVAAIRELPADLSISILSGRELFASSFQPPEALKDAHVIDALESLTAARYRG